MLAGILEPWCGAASISDDPTTTRYDFAERRRLRRRAAVARAMRSVAGPELVPASGSEGEPCWPAGWTGSISHTESHTLAVVARRSDALSLGIDVEPERAVSSEFARRVCSERELERIRQLGAVEELALVVFSAKEALHKLQFPLTREASGLRRIEVLLEPDRFSGTFQRDMLPFASGFTVNGRWRRHHGFVLSAVWLRGGSEAQKNYGGG
jgi:4'-phosphopantetheinyl transferase EntD